MKYTGIQLKRLRRQKGLSQIEVAKKLNVSSTTICLWESGERNPSQNHIKKLCKMYGVSPADILAPKREEDLKMCQTVQEYKDALETKLDGKELRQLAVSIFEEHAENMIEDAARIIQDNEGLKKQLLKELIGI